MSVVNLNLSKDNLALELTKSGVEEIIPCQVSFQLDVSGSFHLEHQQGHTNNLLNRILPFALLFDKDGVLDMFSFSHESKKLTPVTDSNYSGYITKEVMNQDNYNGWSTNYKPAFQHLVENGYKIEELYKNNSTFFNKLFKKKEFKKESIGKHLSFFVTDGIPNDGYEALDYLNLNMSDEHFIVFISVGGSDMSFLDKNFKNKINTDYFALSHEDLRNLSSKSDQDLYSMFLSGSLVSWMNK